MWDAGLLSGSARHSGSVCVYDDGFHYIALHQAWKVAKTTLRGILLDALTTDRHAMDDWSVLY